MMAAPRLGPGMPFLAQAWQRAKGTTAATRAPLLTAQLKEIAGLVDLDAPDAASDDGSQPSPVFANGSVWFPFGPFGRLSARMGMVMAQVLSLGCLFRLENTFRFARSPATVIVTAFEAWRLPAAGCVR